MSPTENPHQVRRWIRYHPQVVIYTCLVLVVVFVLFLDYRNDVQAEQQREREQAQDEIERCQAGVDSRDVQRKTVEAVYNLATGSIARNADDPPLTERELEQYNAYIDRVNNFREDMYAQIKPSKQCAPYVKDDHVKPPTPPTPPIKR